MKSDPFMKSHLLWKAGVYRDAVRHCEERAKDHTREIVRIEAQYHLPASPMAQIALTIEQNARSFWAGEANRHRFGFIDVMAEAR